MSVQLSGNKGFTQHLSVLLNEVVSALAPESTKKYLDGTLGAGGHAAGILEASAPEGKLLGLDLDPEAIELSRTRLSSFQERAIIRKASYLDAEHEISLLGWNGLDGIVLDLGVSSMQIDQPNRGFSFQKEGDLDMRFDPTSGNSASDLINTFDENDLADIIWRFGEERHSRRIASAIVKSRPINRTDEFAAVIRKAVGSHRDKIDPATRTFQAIRIAINKELSTLEKALPKLSMLLNPGGKIAVISFHSLEDRIVKTFFKLESQNCICPS
ncbi:MAG: 16S rRNA (cytosine(1402)-N(4))-methyltransferase RsmH, partial [Anaerolineaceae bacterium]|nr:16S rRNA (cytosine(1402)-N(4))-methyltransferase RsmH [Anaerolineaceae bacterium]